MPRAVSGAHHLAVPAELALPSFPSLNKLRPFETQESFLSPAHAEPVLTLKIQNLAKMTFCGNRYKFLSFHPENEFFGTTGRDLDLQNSPLSGGSRATRFSFNLWVLLVLAGNERVKLHTTYFLPTSL